MSTLSNAEKQARFRKKEELKKFADQCSREAQLGLFQHGAEGPAMLAQIQSIADLPSGWTDEDYDLAVQRIHQLKMELISPNNDLSNDIYDARGVFDEGRTRPLRELRLETDQAIADTRALADHLISAIELTDLGHAERGAAVLEALRHVARSLANERPLRRSDSNIVCLSILPPHYSRPDWFAEAFADWFSYRLGNDARKDEVAEKLLEKRLGV